MWRKRKKPTNLFLLHQRTSHFSFSVKAVKMIVNENFPFEYTFQQNAVKKWISFYMNLPPKLSFRFKEGKQSNVNSFVGASRDTGFVLK